MNKINTTSYFHVILCDQKHSITNFFKKDQNRLNLLNIYSCFPKRKKAFFDKDFKKTKIVVKKVAVCDCASLKYLL